MKNKLMSYISLIVVLVGNLVNAQPLIENPYLIMNPENVLRATLSFNTDVPTKALAVLSNDEHTVTVHSTQGSTNRHQIEILGLHPQTKYTVIISVVDGVGNTTYDHSLQLETLALPKDFPPLKITLTNPDRMQPGITFFDIARSRPNGDWGMIIAIDEQGKVVWYHKENVGIVAVSQLHNQNLLYLGGNNAIEMDMLGNKKHVWIPNQLVPSVSENFHHDVIEMPSGNLLALSRDFRTIDGYTDENGEQIAKQIRGDTIVEFTPEGQVVNQWNVFDMLDPHRIKYDIILPGDVVNWTHANSVFYDERDDSIVLSLRLQDWIIKFDRATGELLWRFGEEGDFLMNENGEWPFQHHAARFLADGSLILFDNGKNRPGIENANDFYSRAVQYKLDILSSDSAPWTATQLWEFRDKEDFYSQFLGEVDHLANGNFLITDGGRVINPELSPRDEKNQTWARIVEVTHTNPSEKVFELIIRDEISNTSYSSYRSEKLANLVLANLGATVHFSNPAQIPTGMELTELLPALSIESEISQPASIDLSVDMFAKGSSILETINILPVLNLPNWSLTQDLAQGYLQLDIENLRFAAQPWKVTHTLNHAMFQVDTTQTLRLITQNGIEVLAQPAIQNPEALLAALQTLGLPELEVQPNGNLKILAPPNRWFSARPNLASLEINKETATGLIITTLPVSLVFEDKEGKKRQQSFFPAPADINVLELVAKRVEFNQGVLSFQWMGKNYQGMLDYEVLQDDETGNLQVSPILNENGNESGDYLLSYPNGQEQKLLALSPT